jgi:S1-C subfamily serine protease
MEKIVISSDEIAAARAPSEETLQIQAKLGPILPTWVKASLTPLVLVLPLLCLVAIVLRVAMRSLPPRNRHAWTAYLASLLVASGLLTSLAVVLIFSFVPLPTLISTGLSDLDERTEFPTLPFTSPAGAKVVSEKLKPLVAVISTAQRSWLTNAEMPSASFGAGVLLQANADGYLLVTARHVVDGATWNSAKSTSRALIAMASGTWGAADVIARHKHLDLALLWVPRQSGHGTFAEALANPANVSEGESVFVIGHPEGLRFTLSTGIISRMESGIIQISAPVSPGNSGGPVFDDRGELVAIVTSMIDKHGDPNAENLNFAVRADALLDASGWDFNKLGQKHLADYEVSSAPKAVVQAVKHP